MPGRVGDSPLIGCGCYCDEFGGVSTTGHGESIMRVVLAKSLCDRLPDGTKASADEALARMKARTQGGCGGVIYCTKNGEVGHSYTTKKMAWAEVSAQTGGNLQAGVR